MSYGILGLLWEFILTHVEFACSPNVKNGVFCVMEVKQGVVMPVTGCTGHCWDRLQCLGALVRNKQQLTDKGWMKDGWRDHRMDGYNENDLSSGSVLLRSDTLAKCI